MSFSTTNSGIYYETSAAYSAYQSGNFQMFSAQVPNSIAGKRMTCTVQNGLLPFADTGTFTFNAAASGEIYTVTGDGVNTVNSSGNYSYSEVNATSGAIQINDSVGGAATVYVAFSSPTTGRFAIKSPSRGGYQIGQFVATDTGALQVTISPQWASTAGAQWQVDGGTFQTSGGTVSNLPVGNHNVTFRTISGWTTPSNQTVSVSANALTQTSGSYVQQFGSLQVTITPAGATNAGAQWQVDGGAWLNSGAIATNLQLGNHTVNFAAISGWRTPASQTAAVSANSTQTTTGNYVQEFGSLKVSITPAGAINAGAKWGVDSGNLQSSGATVTEVPVGDHTVMFSTISGWTTPSNQTVSVLNNSRTTASGTYVVQTGALEVTINPGSAINGGAKWQVDGGKWQNSGATVANLSLGKHTVSFNTISGWVTPAKQTNIVSANFTNMAGGTYVPQTGALEVTINPAAAITAGAQWQVDSGTFKNGGTTVSNLSLTNHTLSFNIVSGWTTPSNQTVAIKAKTVAKEKGTYTFTAKGIYNGLFAQAETNVVSSGMLNSLTVTASGTYSGRLLIGESTNAISGSFNVSGQASNYVKRPAKLGGPLILEMTLNWTASPPVITGTVSGTNGGPWTANLTAELASKATNSADYTMLLPPSGTPPGYGYLLITNHAGAVTLSGALADGTPFIQRVPLSGNGDLPVYGNLYGGMGLLMGWLGLESGAPAGSLAWIKAASHSSALYTNGFTNLAVVQGSRWTNPPPHTAAMDLPFGQLEISGGSLVSNLTFNVAMSNNNTLLKLPGSPTNSLTGTITPKTGLLTVTFGNGAGKATTKGTGAVLQNATNAGGFFLGKTNAGSILLQP